MVAALLLPGIPSVDAHVSAFTASRVVRLGPYNALVDPTPAPLFANQYVDVRALVSGADNGSTIQPQSMDMVLNGTGVQSTTIHLTSEPGGDGYWDAPFTFPHRGNYSADIHVAADKGNASARTFFDVYPDIAFRIQPANTTYDVIPGQMSEIPLIITDRQGDYAQNLFDLEVRIEHWTDDHLHMIGVNESGARPTSPGNWQIPVKVEDTGMYHLRFASDSGHFSYDDVPMLHVYAAQPAPTPPPSNGSPGPGVACVLGALALALLLARRR